jgi:hypothetical protein
MQKGLNEKEGALTLSVGFGVARLPMNRPWTMAFVGFFSSRGAFCATNCTHARGLPAGETKRIKKIHIQWIKRINHLWFGPSMNFLNWPLLEDWCFLPMRCELHARGKDSFLWAKKIKTIIIPFQWIGTISKAKP